MMSFGGGDALQLHSFVSPTPGPALVVLGGVHGDEPCGTLAVERVLAQFTAGTLSLARGRCTLVPVANPLARRLQRREGQRNLNRHFQPSAAPADYESAIANRLCPVLAEHDVLLDLHSFQAAGEAFAMIGPRDNAGSLEPFARATEEGWLARHLGSTTVVEGWLDIYAAALTRRGLAVDGEALAFGLGTNEWMRSQGGYGITLECGQHADPAAPQVGYRAIRATLALLGLIDAPPPPRPPPPRLLRLAGVMERAAPGDRFVRDWASFDRVVLGQPIATRADGSVVHAECDGTIVFPNAQADVGAEWFYWAVDSERELNPPPGR